MKLQLQPIVVGGREGTGSGTIMRVSSPGFTPSWDVVSATMSFRCICFPRNKIKITMVMTKIKIIMMMKMRVNKGSYMKRNRSSFIAWRGRGRILGGIIWFLGDQKGGSVVTENPKGEKAENFGRIHKKGDH